jgi:uncharacterized protein YaaR (DUF327 family)
MKKLGDIVYKDANIQTLLAIIEQVDDKVRQEVLKAIAQRLSQAGKAEAIKRIQAIIQTADPVVKEWIAQAIPKSYATGLSFADYQKKKNSIDVVAFEKDDIKIKVEDIKTLKDLSVHVGTVNALMSDTYLDFANGLNGLAKGAERKLNEAVKRQIRAKIIAKEVTGKSVEKVAREIKQLIGDQGFSVLIDRGGSKWTLKRYSEMLARTHVIKASNEALVNRAGQFGVDIVQVSTHSGACPICTPYEGHLYSLSGDSDNYPTADVALPIHPNCRHVWLMRPDLI